VTTETNCKKFALLPIPSKFGKQEVDRFSQSSSDLVLGNLNVPYMKIFSRSRNFNRPYSYSRYWTGTSLQL